MTKPVDSITLLFDSLASLDCDCGTDEPGTCAACLAPAALSEIESLRREVENHKSDADMANEVLSEKIVCLHGERVTVDALRIALIDAAALHLADETSVGQLRKKVEEREDAIDEVLYRVPKSQLTEELEARLRAALAPADSGGE